MIGLPSNLNIFLMVQCVMFAANGVMGAGMMHRGGRMMAEHQEPAAQNYYTDPPKYSYTTAAPYYTPAYTTKSYYAEAPKYYTTAAPYYNEEPKYYSAPSYTTKAPEYYTTASYYTEKKPEYYTTASYYSEAPKYYSPPSYYPTTTASYPSYQRKPSY